MTIAQTDEPTRQKPLRLWPGVVAVVLQWLARFGVPHLGARGHTLRGDWGTPRRVGCPSCGGRSSAGRLGPNAGAPSS